MTSEELKTYKKNLESKLISEKERKERDIYLSKLANGELQGPMTGYPSVDKPWLGNYTEEEIRKDIYSGTVYGYIKECMKEKHFEDKTAINYYGKKISFSDLLNNKVIEVAKSLKALGLKKGDKVSFCLPTIPETIYLFLAANMLGLKANMIDPRINESRIEECIGTDSKALFTIDVFNDKIAPIARKLNIQNSFNVEASESLPAYLKLLYFLKKGKKKFEGLKSWKEFISNSKNIDSVEEVYNEEAAVVYTSGTTGVPKAAQLSNENIVSVSYQQKHVLKDMKPGDTFLDIMPPFIAYGLVCGMCASLSTGLELIVIPSFKPEDFVNLVLKNKPNIIMGVPAFYEELTNKKGLENIDLSFVKFMVAGGDKMNEESERAINDFILAHGAQNKIVKGYGMTEVSSGVFITYDDKTNKLGSTGQPMIKNNVMVVNPDTKEEVPYNEKGEIYIKSSSIFMGYINNEFETKKVKFYDSLGNCWVRSGDLGYVDEKGNVTISGRLKRMIVRPDGHNVFPTVIEDIILKHPAVAKCCVIGTKCDSTSNGLIPTACVVLKDEYKSFESEIELQLRETCSKQLPPRDVALRYIFKNDLKLTSNGKIDIRTLEDEANEKIITNEKEIQKVKTLVS